MTMQIFKLQSQPPTDSKSDTDVFQMLELRLGSKALDIHRRLLEGEFQLPKAMCESNDACVNPTGHVVDFSTVRIVPFGINMINDITWRCYDEMDYAPGMVQLVRWKGDASHAFDEIFIFLAVAC